MGWEEIIDVAPFNGVVFQVHEIAINEARHINVFQYLLNNRRNTPNKNKMETATNIGAMISKTGLA